MNMKVYTTKHEQEIIRTHYQRKKASTDNKWTQKIWAQEAKYNVNDVKALIGSAGRQESGESKRPVDLEKAKLLCKAIGLDWDKDVRVFCEELLTEVREKYSPYLNRYHGQIKCLNMSQPIDLDDLFVEVKVQDRLTGSLGLGLQELSQPANQQNSKLLGLDALEMVKRQNLQGLEVLGQPGSGKTTFLSWIAILNLRQKFWPDCVSVFVSLSDFAAKGEQQSLEEYIIQHWESQHIKRETTEILLKNGRVLVLLDGLDEVKEAEYLRIVKSVEDFMKKYIKNHFVITCRLVTRKYNFQSSIKVEMADLDWTDIQELANNWFNSRSPRHSATDFMTHLEAGHNNRIRKLANSRLLLILLCLVFENTGKFMKSRAALYKKAIDLLLSEWDSSEHNIQRERYGLTDDNIKNLLIKIAKDTFEKEEYSFQQLHLESWINTFISNLSETKVESSQVLKFIAECGLLIEGSLSEWSFSHLTFHEYFMAEAIKNRCNCESIDDPILNELVENHLTKPRWREVFLLLVELLSDATCLLQIMKQKVDSLVENEEILQEMLNFLSEKSRSVNTKYKPAGVRAFYLEGVKENYGGLICAINKSLDYDLSIDEVLNSLLGTLLYDPNFKKELAKGLRFGLDRTIEPLFEDELPQAMNYSQANDLSDLWQSAKRRTNVKKMLSNAIEKAGDPHKGNQDFKQALQQLHLQLHENLDETEQAWLNSQECKDFAEQLRKIMMEYRGIGYDWQGKFTREQRELLKKYYNANELLANCLFKTNCVVSPEARQEIENTLLLPIAEISPAIQALE